MKRIQLAPKSGMTGKMRRKRILKGKSCKELRKLFLISEILRKPKSLSMIN